MMKDIHRPLSSLKLQAINQLKYLFEICNVNSSYTSTCIQFFRVHFTGSQTDFRTAFGRKMVAKGFV
jgi:hypothetical protein